MRLPLIEANVFFPNGESSSAIIKIYDKNTIQNFTIASNGEIQIQNTSYSIMNLAIHSFEIWTFITSAKILIR